ncbi:P-loop NTPase family protein [Porphyromonas gulae]|uniref:replication protein n=1 Tax=Porphyromonas gulae TaxID=111105 RepID=UPI001F1610F7|nr:replication protein [Porphyromonas gulae]
MDKELIESLRQALTDQAASGRSAKRFRLDGFTEEEVAAMLGMCYASEVERRVMQYVADTETAAKIQKAAKWLCSDTARVGLMLYGGVGNGKSTLARAISNLIGILHNSALSAERKNVYRLTAIELAKLATENQPLFDQVRRQELLMIDDVGTEQVSVKVWGNEYSPVTEVLYDRYDRQLFTLATSNLSDEEMRERYGIRIYDRMEEMFDRLYYKQPSYRK